MRNNDRGIISMITTIMVSILLVTIALGLIILLSGTLQQSSDDELSARAYAAAEGGVEWAIVYLRANPGAQINDCLAPGASGIPNLFTFGSATPSATDQNAITCLRVSTLTQSVTGTLDANGARQIEILPTGSAATSLQDIHVNWIGPADQAPSNTPTNGNTQLPASGPNQAAGLELTIVHFPINGGNINPAQGPSQIQIRNVVFLPANSGGGFGIEPKVIAPACTTGSIYNCHASISATGLPGLGAVGPNEATIVSVRALYLYGNNPNVNFQLQFFSPSGLISVPDQNATIDVTARAGGVYRRIIAQTPVKGNVPGNLNYVLFGDQDVCKQFSFYKGTGGTPTFNPSAICPNP